MWIHISVCRANPAFNKEVFVDLMAAQIKTLSFLAYIVRMYQEMVAQHSSLMVKGLLGMLTICPMEVTHLRKELLIASRHILATDLRVSEYCLETHFLADIYIFFYWF
jgi:transformation/transcription domain-associated protein